MAAATRCAKLLPDVSDREECDDDDADGKSDENGPKQCALLAIYWLCECGMFRTDDASGLGWTIAIQTSRHLTLHGQRLAKRTQVYIDRDDW